MRLFNVTRIDEKSSPAQITSVKRSVFRQFRRQWKRFHLQAGVLFWPTQYTTARRRHAAGQLRSNIDIAHAADKSMHGPRVFSSVPFEQH